MLLTVSCAAYNFSVCKDSDWSRGDDSDRGNWKLVAMQANYLHVMLSFSYSTKLLSILSRLVLQFCYVLSSNVYAL